MKECCKKAAEEAARTERERILNAVNILITAWSVDHKDWREFDVGYTSALEQVAGMIRKDLNPESASDQPPDAGKVIEPMTCETCKAKCAYPYAEPGCPFHKTRPVSAEDVETVRSKVREAFDLGVRHGKWLATYTGPIGILHRVDDIDGQLDRIAGKEE